jgi:guanylate kinase
VPNSSASRSADPLVIVLIGPGGTGKGTVAKRLVARDPSLWLSRSWTTRPRRDGEEADAYVFVDRDAFEAHAASHGFLEWAEFLGHLYGSPVPEAPVGSDALYEIEVEGALQILQAHPDAVVILLTPPSEGEQIQRMRGRGDPEEKILQRVEKGRSEAVRGQQIATFQVVNDDLDRAVGEVLGILEGLRHDAARADPPINERHFSMASKRMTLMDPPIEELLDKVDSKFTLVTLGAKRAREINAYYQGLGEMLGRVVPPQVTSVSGKPLSIAFEEVAQTKVSYHHPDAEELAAEAAAQADAEASGFLSDPFGSVGEGTDATVSEFILSSSDPTVDDVVVDVVDVVDVIADGESEEIVEVISLVVDGDVIAEETIVEVVEAPEGDGKSAS